jgi:hypothetical protein
MDDDDDDDAPPVSKMRFRVDAYSLEAALIQD